jgi:hypothetical protein
MRAFLAVVVAILLSACGGYKPAPVYANEVFENPVVVKVKLDPEDPSSGVYLQDTIAQLAVNRLNLHVTKNVHEAKNYIVVNDYAINTSPANYDENGNVIRYSVNAAIVFAIKDKKGFWSKNIVTNEYVDVAAQAALGTTQKEKAAKVAINKALDEFVVAVIARSKKYQEEVAAAKASQKEEAATPKNQEVATESVDTESESKVSEVVEPTSEESKEVATPIPSKEDKIFNAKDLRDPLAQLRE